MNSIKKFISIALVLAAVCTSASAVGNGTIETKKEILNYMVTVHEATGNTLTNEDISYLETNIEATLARYSGEQELTQEEAATLMPEDLKEEIPA